MAEPAPNDTPTVILPVEKQMFRQEPKATRKGVVLPRYLADDRATKGKNKPRKIGE